MDGFLQKSPCCIVGQCVWVLGALKIIKQAPRKVLIHCT
jgi:hypothetical protein